MFTFTYISQEVLSEGGGFLRQGSVYSGLARLDRLQSRAGHSRGCPQTLCDVPCSTRESFHTRLPAEKDTLIRFNIINIKLTGLSTGLLSGVKSLRSLKA
jgi:hypothetical protein